MTNNRKGKMICVRFSDAEYNALRTQYQTYGARNVSDLARLAIQRIMGGSPGDTRDFAAKLEEVEHRLHALEAQVSVIVKRALAKI